MVAVMVPSPDPCPLESRGTPDHPHSPAGWPKVLANFVRMLADIAACNDA